MTLTLVRPDDADHHTITRHDAVQRLQLVAKRDAEDVELAHINADDILIMLLKGLGYYDVVEAFEAVPKEYYASPE